MPAHAVGNTEADTIDAVTRWVPKCATGHDVTVGQMTDNGYNMQQTTELGMTLVNDTAQGRKTDRRRVLPVEQTPPSGKIASVTSNSSAQERVSRLCSRPDVRRHSCAQCRSILLTTDRHGMGQASK